MTSKLPPMVLQAADEGWLLQEKQFAELTRDYITNLIAMGCHVTIWEVTDRSVQISATLPGVSGIGYGGSKDTSTEGKT